MNYRYDARSRALAFVGILLLYVVSIGTPSITQAQSSLFARVCNSDEHSAVALGTIGIRSPFTYGLSEPYQLYSVVFRVRSERTRLELAVRALRPIRYLDYATMGYIAGDPILGLSYDVLLDQQSRTVGFLTVNYFPLYAYGLPWQSAATPYDHTLLAHCIPVTAGLHIGTLTFGMYLSDMALTDAGKRIGIEHTHIGGFMGINFEF